MLEERIASKIKEVTGKDVEVTYKETNKNNGIIQRGYIIGEKDSTVRPVIYKDESWDDDTTVQKITETFAAELPRICEMKNSVSQVNKENILNTCFATLVNSETNKQRLDDNGIYHDTYLDMEIVYRFTVGDGTVMVTNEMIEKMDIDASVLRGHAISNVEKSMKIMSMKDVLAEKFGVDIPDTDDDDIKMYVGTSSNGLFGASVMISEVAMQELHDLIGSDRIAILPSSVHEIIAVNLENDERIESLKAMVKDVNDTQVTDVDRLTYSVYVHNRTGIIEVK